MSELMDLKYRPAGFRHTLLVSASALALLGYTEMGPIACAAATGDDHPTIWIELGGQAERTDDAQSIFAPLFFDQASSQDLGPMVDAQRPSRYAIGGEGRIVLIPDGHSWTLSVSARYGRSNSARHLHHETAGLPEQFLTLGGNLFLAYTPAVRVFGDGQASSRQSYLIADFQAGKDVGLGMFGAHGSSTVRAGVRIAQFTSKSDITLHARPRDHVATKYNPGYYRIYTIARHTYSATLHADRNSRAIGPSLSWDASLLIAGSDNGTEVTFDWGANAALLFGRQRAKVRHQTAGTYVKGLASGNLVSNYTHGPYNRTRSRSITIPNVGGFAGFSLKVSNAKISLGYRADLFFGATDSGIDAHKTTDQKFYGPFATISMGL